MQLVKRIKLTETDGKITRQVYPETHASAVMGLTEAIDAEASGSNNTLPDGQDLDKLTSDNATTGSKTFILNGGTYQNSPAGFSGWGVLELTDINANTSVQRIYDSHGALFVRGAGGANKTYNSWFTK
jgi:hypothetical protein